MGLIYEKKADGMFAIVFCNEMLALTTYWNYSDRMLMEQSGSVLSASISGSVGDSKISIGSNQSKSVTTPETSENYEDMYNKALDYFATAEKVFEKEKNHKSLSGIYHHKGYIFLKLSEFYFCC